MSRDIRLLGLMLKMVQRGTWLMFDNMRVEVAHRDGAITVNGKPFSCPYKAAEEISSLWVEGTV